MQTLVQAQPIVNWTIVEIPVAVGDRRVAIQDQPMLRTYPGHRVVIKGIECITAKVLTNAVLNSGANITRADLIKSTLVLYSQQWEKVQYMPLARLVSVFDTDSAVGTTIPFVANPVTFEDLTEVDWTKSYIQLANGTSIATAGVIILGIQYLTFNDSGDKIKP